MRHIGTVLGAVVVGPLAWILLAVGQDRSARRFADVPDGGAVDAGNFQLLVLVLAAGGILLGLLATLRFSPLGAVLTGSVYVAANLGAVASPAVFDVLDHQVTFAGHQVDLANPVRTGTALVLGSLLLVGVVSVHRWRRWPRPAAESSTALLPDEIVPATSGPNRPLGADGLGMGTAGRATDSTPTSEWVSGSAQRSSEPGWTAEPGWAGSARRAAEDGSTWRGSDDGSARRGDASRQSESATWQSDPPRHAEPATWQSEPPRHAEPTWRSRA